MQSFLIGNQEYSKSRSEPKTYPGGERASEAPPDVDRALFFERLRREAKRHDPERHPFNLRMLEGRASSEDIRLWVTNTHYCESRVPAARALVLAKLEEPALRRAFLAACGSEDAHRASLAAWETLAEATGIERAALREGSSVLVGVRFACSAYTAFLHEATASEAVVAVLAELLTPGLSARRRDAFERWYTWIDPRALDCLRPAPDEKLRAEALAELLGLPPSAEAREACIAAVIKKSQISWHVFDCIDAASRVKAM